MPFNVAMRRTASAAVTADCNDPSAAAYAIDCGPVVAAALSCVVSVANDPAVGVTYNAPEVFTYNAELNVSVRVGSVPVSTIAGNVFTRFDPAASPLAANVPRAC